MRPTRFRPLPALLILAALLAGCSERAARIAGNERLIRGDDGLGTTGSRDTLVTRDTFAPPSGTTIRGTTLLVGQSGAYEARSLFRVRTWTLPDTTATIDSVFFKIEFDGDIKSDLPPGSTPYSLSTAGAPWDTTTVAWPGPPLGISLGSGPDAQAPFTINLGSTAIGLMRSWASDSAFAGFVLTMDVGSGVRGFKAGTGRFEIFYSPAVGLPDTAVTSIPTDLSIHTPLAPAVGNETLLPLGGFYRAEALLRAPVPAPPPGFSINAAAFVAYLDPTVPVFLTKETTEIRAYRIREPWTEGAPTDSVDATPIATLSAYSVSFSGDSLVIPVPVALAREWSVDSTSNHGILVRVTDSYRVPELRLFSRESARPPVIRVSTTSPPPGRF